MWFLRKRYLSLIFVFTGNLEIFVSYVSRKSCRKEMCTPLTCESRYKSQFGSEKSQNQCDRKINNMSTTSLPGTQWIMKNCRLEMLTLLCTNPWLGW
jgi:hypothetical protein